jgi:hypothetical protein
MALIILICAIGVKSDLEEWSLGKGRVIVKDSNHRPVIQERARKLAYM